MALVRGEILKRTEDLLWATLGEGGLVLALAAIGWAARQPLIFASLGPTAYELVEQPQVRSARAITKSSDIWLAWEPAFLHFTS